MTFAVDSLTNRPVIAGRLPFAPLAVDWVTIVLGCRTAVAALTNLPLPAEQMNLAHRDILVHGAGHRSANPLFVATRTFD